MMSRHGKVRTTAPRSTKSRMNVAHQRQSVKNLCLWHEPLFILPLWSKEIKAPSYLILKPGLRQLSVADLFPFSALKSMASCLL